MEAEVFENTTIINFNYDRTVEQFLLHGLIANAARSFRQEALAEWSPILDRLRSGCDGHG
jgi:hypothetical protein